MPSNRGLDRLTRGLGHDKGSRIKSVTSPPVRSEGKDGDMQIYNGHLYIKDRYTWHHFIPKSEFKIDVIGVGENEETVQTKLNFGSSTETNTAAEKDFRTLQAKINQIIELLQLDIK
tara:strand:+ start:47 stop:397 length:351 start_codon:yes stop_codon:yes gene_type:complete